MKVGCCLKQTTWWMLSTVFWRPFSSWLLKYHHLQPATFGFALLLQNHFPQYVLPEFPKIRDRRQTGTQVSSHHAVLHKSPLRFYHISRKGSSHARTDSYKVPLLTVRYCFLWALVSLWLKCQCYWTSRLGYSTLPSACFDSPIIPAPSCLLFNPDSLQVEKPESLRGNSYSKSYNRKELVAKPRSDARLQGTWFSRHPFLCFSALLWTRGWTNP